MGQHLNRLTKEDALEWDKAFEQFCKTGVWIITEEKLIERNSMKREDVYKLIDGERDYQDAKPPRPEGDAVTPVANWILYIRQHLGRAADQIYWLDRDAALEDIRKIAALAVACMEYNDTKERKE